MGRFIRRRDFISLVGCTATLLLLHAMTSACAADIVVREAWSRATPKGAQVASGYLTIENRSNSSDRLLSASTPAAGKVEIHEMLDAGGIMKMRPATEGLTIPPSGHLFLTPGGKSHDVSGIEVSLLGGRADPGFT